MILDRIKLLFFILLPFLAVAQKRTATALRSTEGITVDGRLDEGVWANAEIASGFVMFEPDNGKPATDDRKTEVRVVYDDDAVYFGAILYDDPALILKEIALRDDFKTADHFGIFINGFNDGQQDFRFLVSAAGTQMDCVATQSGGEDYSWDAIWHSEVRLTDSGWVVEMKIPYAALRFSDAGEQFWGINFYREVRRDRQKYSWNPIDRNIGNTIVQAGLLKGITNIKPPTRLFFIPYSSLYVTNSDAKGTDTQFKVGMDIKYGLNDAFTLDAILVPDFGQAAFDEVVLNLGPFEQQFNENRPFFTEGTDLFNKGDLLYTRRIGGRPAGRVARGEDEVVETPSAVNLINALKISGRTANGLGIGVMNAITEATYATITNTTTGQTREEITEPLVNYNVTVFDQRFRKNSSVSFINTNVTRSGRFKDANVSALVYDLNTRANTFNLSGNFKFSHINDVNDRSGYSSYISAGKTSGKFRYNLSTEYVAKDFDINDLGYIAQTNYHNVYATGSYRILNPTKLFNTFQFNTGFYSEFHNDAGKMQSGRIDLKVGSNTRKNDYIGYGVEINPFYTYDFYEPRVEGRYVQNPKSMFAFIYFSSNYNRKFALDIQPEFWTSDHKGRKYYGLLVSPRYRFNDRLLMVYSFNYGLDTSQRGWVGFEGDDIIFTRRDRSTYTSSLSGKYSVTNKMTVNLTARHYYTYGENLQFLTLQDDGGVAENTTFNESKDFTYNNWNFDLSYTWWFAPGSQLSVLYRNNAANDATLVSRNYGENFTGLFKNNLNNIFSISLRYYIDYNEAKNWI